MHEAPDLKMRYVEKFGTLMAEYGLPRMSGRIMGWLMVCDPPTQSLTEVAAALQASKGSISTSIGMLVNVGLIERLHVAGSRQTYYRMSEGVWEKAFASKVQVFSRMRDLAAEGLVLLGDDQDARARLEEMRDLYAYAEGGFREMLAGYSEHRRTKGAGR